MCTWSVESTKGIGKETWFDFEVFKEVIDVGVKKGLQAIRLNYINEPLIRKDLVKFIEYAHSAGLMDIYMSTNGSLLTEEISRLLINSGLTRIQISLDAASEKTYNDIRPSNFTLEEVTQNVLKFIEIRNNEFSAVLPAVRVNFVKTSINESELEKFINFWKEKVDGIGIQDLVNIMKPTKNILKGGIKDFKCVQPFQHLVVRYNGHILPCCTFFGAELPIAKLKSETKPEVVFSRKKNVAMTDSPLDVFKDESRLLIQTIEEAWHSEQMTYLRDIHRKGEYWKNAVCKKCVESTSHHDETQG
jgi:MoaA/NifB/PqqE/SkfB family radical SAM enzyme